MTIRPFAAHAARPGLPRILCGAVALTLAITVTACNLDLQNPNSPREDQVLSNVDGAIALAVGMQGQFATTIDDYLVTNSLVTDEWGTQTKALISYQSLFTGPAGAIDPSYDVVLAPWRNSYQTIKSANTLLADVPKLGLDPALANQFTALAKLYKAMSLGMLIQQYAQVPIDITVAAPTPQPRAVVLDTVLALLNSADSDLAQVTDADIN